MACQPGYIEDAQGQCVLINIELEQAPINPNILPDPPPVEQGDDQDGLSWDYDYTPPDKDWLDDPSTGGDSPNYVENEFAQYMFEEVMGGYEGTGYETGEEWWAEFGGDFPSWEESPYYQQYISILEQGGIVDEQERLRGEQYGIDKEGLALTGLSKVAESVLAHDKIQYGAESQFIAAGGGVSGRNIRAVEAASEGLDTALTLDMTALGMDRSLLDIAYDDDLYDIESQRLEYQDDLRDEAQKYEDELRSYATPGEGGISPYDRTTCSDTCEGDFTCIDGWCQPVDPADAIIDDYYRSSDDDFIGKDVILDCMNLLGAPGGEGDKCWQDIKDLPQEIIDGMGLGDEYDAIKKRTDQWGNWIEAEWDEIEGEWKEFEGWYQSGETAEEWENVKSSCSGMGTPDFNPDDCLGQLGNIPEAFRNDALSALGIDDEYADLQDWYTSGAVNKNWEEVKDACAGMGSPNFDGEACLGQIGDVPYSVLESLGLNDEYDALNDAANQGLDWTKGKLNEVGEWVEGAYNEAGDFIEGAWDEAGNLLNEAGELLYDTAGDIWEAGTDVAEDVVDYVEDDLLDDLTELGEAAVNAACKSGATPGCTADATKNTSIGWGYGKKWKKNFNNCINYWCG